MQISIIIPAYNYGHVIERAIQSIMDQNDQNYEIIVVDDGSTDSTEEIVKKYTQQYPVVHYIKQKNAGPASARNHGVKHAKGDFLLFLDADDQLLPNSLKVFRQFMESHPAADVIFGGHITIDGNDKIRKKILKPLSADPIKNFKKFVSRKTSFCNGASLFRKRVFEKISYPEELRMAEDTYVFAYALAFFNCYTIPDLVLEIFKHPRSLRNQISLNRDVGLKTVNTIFDPTKLPQPFMTFKKIYCSKRCLALFRGLYLAGEYKEARPYYHCAIKSYPRNLLLWPYLRKYLSSFLH